MLGVIAAAFFMAWAIGANDSAKAVGTAVGSGIVGFRRAVLIIAVFTTLGATLSGSGVSETITALARGLSPAEIALVLFSSASAVTLASLWGKPISTTQSIIGALVGSSLALGFSVDWWTVGKIVSAWFVSPVFASVLAIATYKFYKPVLKRIKCLRSLELTQKWLVFLASAFSAFNLGANEVSNVTGLAKAGGIAGPNAVLALVAALGALTFSYEVMMTLGRNLAPLGPTSAFASQFGASIAVSVANVFGLPVSSGQAIVGAISGLSLYKGEHVNKKLLLDIVKSWVRAPFFSGLLAFVLVRLFSAGF
ncbi:sodium:phosphate symporter [Thermococcus eurythermalis]|uniref:Sodium:phosphate symporter n=1 Tax=Thermococcus eurythermalis TaxID=1505907 RepID=A0A097QUS4_9EURY|nr:inorganic phosphate transporter [Thermococcus eurythermalis]AIU70229.1 sodium:phosphate symporter [Thermococcus eurythermalis]